MMLAVGTRVAHRGRPGWGTGVVLRCAEHLGGDGRHWAHVEFSGGWKFHAETCDLLPVEEGT